MKRFLATKQNKSHSKIRSKSFYDPWHHTHYSYMRENSLRKNFLPRRIFSILLAQTYKANNIWKNLIEYVMRERNPLKNLIRYGHGNPIFIPLLFSPQCSVFFYNFQMTYPEFIHHDEYFAKKYIRYTIVTNSRYIFPLNNIRKNPHFII